MTDSETKKAAYRWVAELIAENIDRSPREMSVNSFAEVLRIRDAMAQAGAIEVASPPEGTIEGEKT